MSRRVRRSRTVIGLIACALILFVSMWLAGSSTREAPIEKDDAKRRARAAPRLLGVDERPPLRAGESHRDMERLTVRVVDEEGQLVPHSEAYLIAPAAFSVDRDATNVQGKAGEFRVDRSAMIERVLVARATGFVPQNATWDHLLSTASGGITDLPLDPGHTVRGRVRDPWGRPIEGATVQALGRFGQDVRMLTHEGSLPGVRVGGDLQETTTTKSGQFSLSGILRFPVQIIPCKQFHVRDFPSKEGDVRSDAQAPDLVLLPLAWLGVKIVDDISGEGIAFSRSRPRLPKGVQVRPWHLACAHSPLKGPPDPIDTSPGETWHTLAVGAEVPVAALDGLSMTVSAEAPYYETATAEVPLRWPDSDPPAWKPHVIRLRRAKPFRDLVPLRISCRSELGLVKTALFLKLHAPDAEESWSGYVITRLDAHGDGTIHVPPGPYLVEAIPLSLRMWWRMSPPGRNTARHPVEVREDVGGSLSISLDAGIADVVLESDRGLYYNVALYRPHPRTQWVHHCFASSLSMQQGEIMRHYRDAFKMESRRFSIPLPAGKYMVAIHLDGEDVEHATFEIRPGIRTTVRTAREKK